jgi:hypothetical protein
MMGSVELDLQIKRLQMLESKLYGNNTNKCK